MAAQNAADNNDTGNAEIQAMGDDRKSQTAQLRETPVPEQVQTPEFPPQPRARRAHRRVTTNPVAGTDPTPAPEPSRSSGTENDARLKADKPPHWG